MREDAARWLYQPAWVARRVPAPQAADVRDGSWIVLVSDAEMEQAAQSLWFEFGIAADLSGAAAVAALQAKRFVPAPGSKVCALVCGAGTDGT